MQQTHSPGVRVWRERTTFSSPEKPRLREARHFPRLRLKSQRSKFHTRYKLFPERRHTEIASAPAVACVCKHSLATVSERVGDEQGQISRDPPSKRLLTRRESLTKPSKHASNSAFAHLLAIHMPNKFIPAVTSPHEKTVKREFTNFVSSSSS